MATSTESTSAKEPEVEGRFLKGNKAVIDNSDMIRALQIRGFGDYSSSEQKEFVLTPFESLYLVYVGRLILKQNRVSLNFDDLIQTYKKSDKDILTKFLIYRDLRTRDYVVKDGFGFGSDFRVYDKGHFGEKDAKYLVFALNEGQQERIGALHKKISDITQMGKEPIIAVLERRGEPIYYKISDMVFPENPHRTDNKIKP